MKAKKNKTKKQKKEMTTSISPVVVAVVGDIEGIDVGGIMMHSTSEGSGLHVPFSLHTESDGVGVNSV